MDQGVLGFWGFGDDWVFLLSKTFAVNHIMRDKLHFLNSWNFYLHNIDKKRVVHCPLFEIFDDEIECFHQIHGMMYDAIRGEF